MKASREDTWVYDASLHGIDAVSFWFATTCLAALGIVGLSAAPAWIILHGRLERGVLFFSVLGAAALASALWLFRRATAATGSRIVINFPSRTIRFEWVRLEHNLRWPSPPIPEMTIGFDEIVSAERIRNSRGPDTLWVVTPRGRVSVGGKFGEFDALADFMIQHAAGKPPLGYSQRLTWIIGGIGLAIIVALVLLALRYDKAADAIIGWLSKPF